MGKVACYNALKPPGGEMFGREKAGKRQAGTAGCRGRSASWREGRTSYKIKDWGWRVAFWPASPNCRLFYTDKRLFRLCNVDLYCSGGISIGPETCFRRLPLQRAVLLLFCGCG